MFKRISAVVATLTLAMVLGATISAATDDLARLSGLTVHEWGTFTSVAGADGQAVPWLPLSGPSDLPCFVHVYENRLYKSFVNTQQVLSNPLDYFKARNQLRGSIRMETPVLYFYSPRPETTRVRVAFPQGFVTEWYPQATVNQIPVRAGALDRLPNTGSSITWKKVEVLPFATPDLIQGKAASHYYAARKTDAAILRVDGSHEKFLFYRGVGSFPVPMNVTVTDSGKIRIKHLAGKPGVILFENRGGKLGYRIVDTRENEALLDPPALTGSFLSLRQDLESMLTSQGLYAKEAKAMVETWRDSWFEEGTRIFYIVPQEMVDTILPLTVEPKPEHTARVFVGRIEVITPSAIQAVENAVAANDTKTLHAYGRFLGAITERMPKTNRTVALLNDAFRNYLNNASGCSN